MTTDTAVTATTTEVREQKNTKIDMEHKQIRASYAMLVH